MALFRMEVIGHLGKDAVVARTDGGKTVINFNVANTQKYKDRQGQVNEKTTWVSCSYWIENTAIAPYLLKGTQVYVEGQPSADWYNNNRNAADGITAQLKLNVRTINLLGKAGGGGQQQGSGQQSNQHGMTVISDASNITEPIDDLPF